MPHEHEDGTGSSGQVLTILSQGAGALTTWLPSHVPPLVLLVVIAGVGSYESLSDSLWTTNPRRPGRFGRRRSLRGVMGISTTSRGLGRTMLPSADLGIGAPRLKKEAR